MPQLEGTRLGGCEVGKRIGRGGMADVYLAYQPRLRRNVALKVLSPFLVQKAGYRERFEREAQAVAALRHPAILEIYDYGQEGDITYLVMPYISGGTLRDRLKKGPLSPEQALPYIIQAAEAIQYAHFRNIIHRDIKPTNLLIDSGERVLLADFGIAKLLQGKSSLTTTGTIPGTADYMAPEQALGHVEKSSDLYSLAVILYELLAGRLPFTGPPMTVIYQHCHERPPLLRELRPEIPAEVEYVLQRALEKQPASRYPTPAAFVAALQVAVQDIGEALTLPLHSSAKPGNPDQKVAPTGPAAASPELGIVCASCGQLNRVGARFCNKCQVALAGTGFQSGKYATGPLLKNVTLLYSFSHGELVFSAMWSPDGRVLASASAEGTIKLWDTISGQELRVIAGHSQPVTAVAWSPRDNLLVSGSWDGTVRIWDAGSGNPDRTLTGHGSEVHWVGWSPDGKTLASSSRDGEVRLWNTGNWQVRRIFAKNNHAMGLSWSPDSARLASGLLDNSIMVWDVASGKQVYSLRGHREPVKAVSWSPDGKLLASAAYDCTVGIWHMATGATAGWLVGHQKPVTSVAWSPDSRLLASASVDKTVKLWQSRTQRELWSQGRHSAGVYTVAWSPDGHLLASGSKDGIVRVWEVNR